MGNRSRGLHLGTVLALWLIGVPSCDSEPKLRPNPVKPEWLRRDDPPRVSKESDNSVYLGLDKSDPAGLLLECTRTPHAILVTTHFPYHSLLEGEVFMTVDALPPKRVAEPGTGARRSVALPPSAEHDLHNASSLLIRSGSHRAKWALAGLNGEVAWLRSRCVEAGSAKPAPSTQRAP